MPLHCFHFRRHFAAPPYVFVTLVAGAAHTTPMLPYFIRQRHDAVYLRMLRYHFSPLAALIFHADAATDKITPLRCCHCAAAADAGARF